MTELSGSRQPGFVLFTNGSHFSCQVLKNLLARDYSPRIIVLPEYPGSEGIKTAILESGSCATNPILDLANDIEIRYGPEAEQQSLASELEPISMDFMLVACWPYLIDMKLVRAIAKAAYNLHPSLLPQYPGPDPVSAQLAAGEVRFGVSLHELTSDWDRGEIACQKQIDLSKENRNRRFIERQLAALGVELFIQTMESQSVTDRTMITETPIELT